MSVEGCPLSRLPPHVVDGGPSAIIQVCDVGVVLLWSCNLCSFVGVAHKLLSIIPIWVERNSYS